MAGINISSLDFNNLKTNVTCRVIKNNSLPISIIEICEGIPFHLIINLIFFVLVLAIFPIWRKITSYCGCFPLISRNDDQMENSLEQNSTESTASKADNCCNRWRIEDAEIIRKCGHGAYIYLLFQRYLIVYVLVIAILSSIIIPFNRSGSYFSNDFGSLTIANSKTEYLWVHCLMALIYLLLAVIFMQHFSYRLVLMQEKMEYSRTVMISNISNPNEEIIRQYLTNRYAGESVVDIQFAYDVAELTKLNGERRQATSAKLYSEQQNNQNGKVFYLYQLYSCGYHCVYCFCQCRCTRKNAVEFYSDLEKDLQDKIEKEDCKLLGIVFMTMRDSNNAENVRRNWIGRNGDGGFGNVELSDINPMIPENTVSTDGWKVQLASPVDNIIWENLSISGYKWWLIAILVYTIVFIVCLLLTTLVVFVEKLELIIHRPIFDLIDKFIPSVLLFLFTRLFPHFVSYVDKKIGRWTRDTEYCVVMTLTFIFLILLNMIFPSLGFTGVRGVSSRKIHEQYRCIFAKENVVFFYKYLITATFFGTGLDLLCLIECLFRCFTYCCSSVEHSAKREAREFEFHFGFEYAGLLCITAVILTYNLPCPLVAIPGIFYLVFKHFVDWYNIYFVYRPLRCTIDLHTTAGTLFVATAIFAIVRVLASISMRISSGREFVFIFAIIILALALFVFGDHVRFGLLKRLITNHLFNKYSTCLNCEAPDIRNADEHVPYIAPVLLETKYCSSDPNCANTT